MSTTQISDVTGSPEELRAIRKAREQVNAARAAADPPLSQFANNKQYLEWVLDSQVIPSLVRSEAESHRDLDEIREAFKTGSDAKRDAILAAARTQRAI